MKAVIIYADSAFCKLDDVNYETKSNVFAQDFALQFVLQL